MLPRATVLLLCIYVPVQLAFSPLAALRSSSSYLAARGFSAMAMPCEAFGRQSVVEALKAIKQGKVIVVTDDESRENEGDLIMAAEFATPETIGFIVRYSSGVICTPLTGERLDALELPPMYVNNEDPKQTAFTVSVDLKVGTSTGISAADRAATFRALADPASTAADFLRPGHVFPLRPRDGGVLVRDGHTEATMDFCRLAGLNPCGVLCEVVNEDGSMARVPDLIEFCTEHGLVLTSIADLIEYVKELRDEGKLEELGWSTRELQAASLLESAQAQPEPPAVHAAAGGVPAPAFA